MRGGSWREKGREMQTVTVSGLKGDTGKTTLAALISVAAKLAAGGRAVSGPLETGRLTMSEVAGRSEARAFVSMLTMPEIKLAA